MHRQQLVPFLNTVAGAWGAAEDAADKAGGPPGCGASGPRCLTVFSLFDGDRRVFKPRGSPR
ncbi:hypothetical protein ACFV5N_13775 [Streptomyces sp. NPDC059853]|uniref:hypothetical protein n=1 Tax=Streptomyces sp. NPDC059853 TaxID=3346973 RepID=UPI003651E20F